MVAIGIGVFVVFNMQWRSLEKDTGDFLTETNYADFRIMNEKDFTESDISAIKAIDSVRQATRVLNVNVDIKNEKKSLALFAAEDYAVSTMLVTSGKIYDKNLDAFG